MNNLAVLNAIVTELVSIDCMHVKIRLLYLKFGAIDAQESSQTAKKVVKLQNSIRHT